MSPLAFLSILTLTSAATLTSTLSGSNISAISPAAWQALNSSVGNRLYAGVPLARPCFALAGSDVKGTPDQAACTTVQANYANSTFVADNFGGYQQSNWATCQASYETKQCLLDYNSPANPLAYSAPNSCQQGSVSSYYIEVQKASDVQAAFAFAGITKIPLVVKNSGHDYKGRSSGPASLALWLHKLQGITRNKAFIPQQCSTTTKYDTVTFQAGQNIISLYEYAEANNITILGGSSSSVAAAGGYMMGGGHSALSNTLGLAVDRVVQITVVTPDGQLRNASACSNQDLFFALRGGGGSTFGVVLSSTVQVAPRLTLQVSLVKYVSTDPNSMWDFTQICISNAQKWAKEGWGGYIVPGAQTTQVTVMILLTPLLNNSAAVQSMSELMAYVNQQTVLQAEVVEVTSFYQAYINYIQPNEEKADIGLAVGSRLIPSDNFNAGANASALLNALQNGYNTIGTNVLSPNSGSLAYGGAPFQILVTTPFNYKNPLPSAVTPAWRTSIWHIFYGPAFNHDATSADVSAQFHKADAAAQFLRDITPGSGAYQNEASIFEPNHEQSFWGLPNYNKLVSIKNKYDSKNILTCWHCIGYNASDARYACYPK